MKYLLGIIIAIIAIFSLATPAYAIDLPDSTPEVESINCYRNLLETGDFLIVVYENTPYTTTPDIDYGDAFIWRLFDTDGTTELAQATGYDYNEAGYGYNLISFYFSASEAPTWGQQYYLRLSGTPSAFPSPPEYNYQIETTDYSSFTESADVEAELTAHILNLAQDLDNKWGLEDAYSLLLEIETGTVLSIYGEAFFRGAIYGCQALAPQVFRLVINEVDTDPRAWTDEYSENLSTQYAGTWVEGTIDAGGDLFGVDYNLLGIIIMLLFCVGVIIANIAIGGDQWGGFIDAAVVLVIAARIGFYGLGELALVAAICWLYISARLWKVA